MTTETKAAVTATKEVGPTKAGRKPNPRTHRSAAKGAKWPAGYFDPIHKLVPGSVASSAAW
jgi:hypothetical protein